MKILGLTGSIGMGKSTVAQMLRDLDVPVFDADAAVHELQGPNGALVPLIEAAFPGTTDASGVVRPCWVPSCSRTRTSSRLWSESSTRRRGDAGDFLRDNAEAPLVVFDIPLLYEKGSEKGLDAVAVVSAPAGEQRRRVLARPGMTAEKFEQILALQVPDAQKRARADYVIDTGLTLDATREQVAGIVQALRRAE
ncbi:dephospho-CoA kinase [Novosphingobium resinovorum]